MNTAEKAKEWAGQATAIGMDDLAAELLRFAEREESGTGQSRFEPETKETKR